MDKYYNMKNIRDVKLPMMIGSMIRLFDIIICAAVPILVYKLTDIFRMNSWQMLGITLLSFCLTVFLVKHSVNNPKEPNIKLLIYGIAMDQKHYYALDRMHNYAKDLDNHRNFKRNGDY